MKNSPNAQKQKSLAVVAAVLAVTVVCAAVTYKSWLPIVRGYFEHEIAADPKPGDDHDHSGHDHTHPGHVEESAIEFSVTGLKNIDFQPVTVALSTFERSITLPAMVVERPGHSQIYITAPLTGVVTRIYPVENAAVASGTPMFDIRLTHEELVASQRNFLQTVESLDVIQSEIDRLQAAGEGIIAGKRIIEQQYEQQKLQASLRAEQQALLLHGITQEQIDAIKTSRHLLQSLTVVAPDHADDEESCPDEHLFHVQKLPVKLGEHVDAGQLLCVVADHCELYIEGRAFEDDVMRLREAARESRSITATVVVGRRQTDKIEGHKLLFLADHVDAETRAFRFYLVLPNQVVLDQVAEKGRHFIAWRFNPGQRMELRVPVELWPNRIVLPITAIVEEGAETFVYERNGDHFDRVAVHVEYKDQSSAVISNDGSIKPGDVVAAKGAYQMHLALKSRSGGAVDPHAGHSH